MMVTEVDEKKEVLARKHRLCVAELNACVPDALEALDARHAGACAACVAVAGDFDFVARRGGLHEVERDAAWLAEELRGACEDVGFRHATTALLESTCEALLDDHEAAVVREMERHYRDLRAREYYAPHVALGTLLCSEVLGYCPPPSKEDL